MGLGHTLMEHYLFDDEGRIRNLGAIDYRIPTSMDLPLEMTATSSRTGRPRAVRREGHERGRAAVRRAGGRGGGPRRDRRRDPRPAAHAGAGLAGAPGRGGPARDLGPRPLDARSADARRARALLGGKAANLAMMARDLGLPVPPGFTITTEACRAYLAARLAGRARRGAPGADGGRRGAVGRRFGDAGGPAAGLRPVGRAAVDARDDGHDPRPRAQRRDRGGARAASGAPAFARGCRERFRATYRSAPASTPDDPWAQLRRGDRGGVPVVERRSGRRLPARRRASPTTSARRSPSRRWCSATAGRTRATGVLFTRNPATGERDALRRRAVRRAGRGRRRRHPRDGADRGARRAAAGGGRRAARHADRLERHYADLCDIEFTIEDGRLWLLQVRVGKRSPQAALRMAVDMAEDPAFPLSREEAVRRVRPILADPPRRDDAPGAASAPAGHRARRPRRVSPWARSSPPRTRPSRRRRRARRDPRPPRPRRTTSTGWPGRPGILTSHGGLASHAAVVARGWGIPAVVGAAEVQVGDGRVAIGGRGSPRATTITIDGAPARSSRAPSPGERGRARGRDAARLGPRAGDPDRRGGRRRRRRLPATPARGVASDDALRALPSRASHRSRASADALGCRRRTRSSRCSTRSSPTASPRRRRRRVPADRRRQGAGRGAGRGRADELGYRRRDAALDAFLALDQRMKAIVTDWQMRDPTTLNDHTDAAYDAAVLDRLAALHADAEAWLDADRGRLPAARATTATRLGRAPRPAAGRRRPVRRLTPRRQLPRRLVRAPRGPDPPRRPDPRGRGRRRPRLASLQGLTLTRRRR